VTLEVHLSDLQSPRIHPGQFVWPVFFGVPAQPVPAMRGEVRTEATAAEIKETLFALSCSTREHARDIAPFAESEPRY
jgi:hypothetical protein